MKWQNHTLEAGEDRASEHPHHYTVVSADMPYSKHADKVHAGFVSEWERDRFVKLWNSTRHLENNELELLLSMLKSTQIHAMPNDPADMPKLTTHFPMPSQFTGGA
jgi:hypothetical protein